MFTNTIAYAFRCQPRKQLYLIAFVDLVPVTTEKVSLIRSNTVWNRWKSTLFETRNTDNTYMYNLRRINDCSHTRYNCNLGRNSVRYRGPIVWNLIPKAIRDASSQQLFKQKLRHASRILDQIQFEKEACQITSKQTGFLYF